jgi:glutathione S-transferase
MHRWFMTPLQRPAFAALAACHERLSEWPAFLKHGRNGIE